MKKILLLITLQFFIGCDKDMQVNSPQDGIYLEKSDDTLTYPIEITNGKYCAFVVTAPVIYKQIYAINNWLDWVNPNGFNTRFDSGSVVRCSVSVGNKDFYCDLEIPVNWEDFRIIRSFVNKRGLNEIEGIPYYPQVKIPLRSGRYCSIGIQRPVTYTDIFYITWDFMITWTPMYLRNGQIYTYDYIGVSWKKATLTIEHPVTKEDINDIRFFVQTNDWSKITPEIRREPLM